MLQTMGSQRVGHDGVIEWNARRVCILLQLVGCV